MSDNPKLLVVDDEEVICQACRRIFSRQGFQVEVNTDACEGLNCALRDDYAAILLDIKMPKIDGIQFLERLRETKPDQPVLIMTGYPSIPNASRGDASGGLGLHHQAVSAGGDHAAVQRIMGQRSSKAGGSADGRRPTNSVRKTRSPKKSSSLTNRGSGWRSTIRRASGRCCRVCGARRSKAVRLPRIGEVVYQGLPLAALSVAGKPPVVVRSPVSGVVAGVNDALADEPALVTGDPCGRGWIACLCTTRFEEEVNSCKPRHVLLVNADARSAESQSRAVAVAGLPRPTGQGRRRAGCGAAGRRLRRRC